MGESTAHPERAAEIPVAIEISADRLAVILTRRSTVSLEAPDAGAIVNKLAELGIKLDATGEERVHELCRVRKGNVTPVIVASGTAPIEDTPALLELLNPLDAVTPRSVAVDEPVARIIPLTPGRDGIDVFGRPIHRRAVDALPEMGSNLKPTPDGQHVAASTTGILRVRSHGSLQVIAVVTALRHEGDITSEMGSFEYPGDITVQGNITAGAILRVGGGVQVYGDAEADEVLCGGDMHIDGVIKNRDKSRYIVTGNISVRAIHGARVDASGDITVSTVIEHSRIACRGKLKIETGEILVSHITAAGGLICQSIGSAAFSKTLIEVGIDDHLRRSAGVIVPEIEARRAKASKIRQAIEPLLRSATVLNQVQRNRVSAYLLEADEFERTAQKLAAELRREYEDATARFRSEILISQRAFPGTTLRFPGVETTLRMAIKGPCRIAAQSCDGRPRIMLFADGKSTGAPLEVRQFTDTWLDTIKQAAA